MHVGWSGNSVLRVERTAAHGATIGGGEHLLPGEVVLPTGASYVSPWVYVAASDDGLDGLAAAWHAYQRSLDAHPAHQPVVLNVWEAVFFDHDLDRFRQIADRARERGRGAVRARRRLVPRPPRRHRRPRRLDGRRAGLARRAGPAHRPRAGARAWSSGSGSSRRWSTRTPTSTARTRSGSCRPAGRGAAAAPQPAGPRPDPSRGRRPPLRPGARRAVGARHRLREVGPQPRPARGRVGRARRGAGRARADPRVLRPARPAARGAPRRRVGVVRLGRRADRPRRARTGAAGVDLRHDRRPGTPADPALDHPAGRAGVRRRARLGDHLAHHAPHPVPGLPGRDGALRRVRHRVGPHRGLVGGAGLARRPGSSGSSGSARCCTPGAWSGPSPATRPCCCTGSSRLDRDVRRWSRTCSSTSRRTTAASRSGCPASRRIALYALAWEGPVADRETSMSARPPETGPTAGQPGERRRARARGFWMPRMRPETVTLVRVNESTRLIPPAAVLRSGSLAR